MNLLRAEYPIAHVHPPGTAVLVARTGPPLPELYTPHTHTHTVMTCMCT